MEFQNILVVILFLAAIAYIVRVFWKATRNNSEKSGGCSHCATPGHKKVHKYTIAT